MLPSNEGMLIAFTLQRAQNGAYFKIGPLSVLNFEMATQVGTLYFKTLMKLLDIEDEYISYNSRSLEIYTGC